MGSWELLNTTATSATFLLGTLLPWPLPFPLKLNQLQLVMRHGGLDVLVIEPRDGDLEFSTRTSTSSRSLSPLSPPACSA